MGVGTDEQRSGGTKLVAEITNGLGNGRNVVCRKTAAAGLTAMA